MRLPIALGLVLMVIRLTIQASNPNSPTYNAAVVEFHPVSDNRDGVKAAEANAENFNKIIKRAGQIDVDIIVFPEYGLTSLPKRRLNITEYRHYYKNVATQSPPIEKKAILCKDSNPKIKNTLKSISCAAKEFKIYVVANHIEKVDCPPANSTCSPDNITLYNTNFVFDRQGRLIARYRKSSTYIEAGLNITKTPEPGTFTTDFNVTFGQAIGSDLIRPRPINSYVKNPNITDVILTNHWYEERPLLRSLGLQAAWAYGADVNLLASGTNNLETGSTGSGLYAGKSGTIRAYRNAAPANALVVAEITKMNRRNRPEELLSRTKAQIIVFSPEEVTTYNPLTTRGQPVNGSVYTQEELRGYTTEPLDTNLGTPHINKLCNHGVCCEFHVETIFDKTMAERSGANYYRYRLAVFNGVRQIANETTAGLEVCALIACIGPELTDCSRDFPPNTHVVRPLQIKDLIITRSDADVSNHSLYMPLTLNRDSHPLNATDFGFVSSGHVSSSRLVMYLAKPKDDISVFGIVGRKFNKDGQAPTFVSGAPIISSILGMSVASNLLALAFGRFLGIY